MRIFTLPFALSIMACQGAGPRPSEADADADADADGDSDAADAPWPIDESAMDRAVDPCDDFYAFACGGWLDQVEIPADRGATRRVDEVADRAAERMSSLLDGWAEDPDATALSEDERKAGRYFTGCLQALDEETAADVRAAAEAAARARLAQELAAVAAIDDDPERTAERVARTTARIHLAYGFPFFTSYAWADIVNPDQVVLHVDQGGLTLYDPSLYGREDPFRVRDRMTGTIRTAMGLLGDDDVEVAVDPSTVLAIETTLAGASLSASELRDPASRHHRLDRAGVAALVPSFDWDAYFDELGGGQASIAELEAVNVVVPHFLEALEALLSSTPVEEIQEYLAWHWVSATLVDLGPAFREAAFGLDSFFTGADELEPARSFCRGDVNWALGDVFARRLVDDGLGEDGVTEARAVLDGVRQAFAARLDTLDWLDDASRREAHAKLEAMTDEVGRPARWRDYSALEIAGASYLDDDLRTRFFLRRLELSEVGAPPDPDAWYMPATEVNAYYDPSNNEMVFPAGILTAPFFVPGADPRFNLAAIGSIMGHELVHGFDDTGRQYDAEGALRDWWSPAMEAELAARGRCLVDQFDAAGANGALTVGENIADLGGAHAAYAAALRAGGASAGAHGMTPEQLFFVALGQVHCESMTPEMERALADTDPHAPARARVDGMLSNMPEFAAAFACAPDAPMVRADRCEVW